MDQVIFLEGKRQQNKSLVGGKASSLNILLSKNVNVPSGFVVTTNSFKEFTDKNNLDKTIKTHLSSLRNGDSDTFAKVSTDIKKLILESNFPKDIADLIKVNLAKLNTSSFAIRSSAAFEDSKEQSWAGQFNSFLNVEEEDVVEKVKEVWASLFNAHAMIYDPKRYVKDAIPTIAVIIQEMIPGQKSGVSFSLDPSTLDTRKVLIEATLGTGDSLVSGRDIPYSAIMDKKDGLIVKRNFDSGKYADLMTLSELKDIVLATAKIEGIYSLPVDIEWTIKDDVLYIVQARPITFLNRTQNKKSNALLRENYEMTFKVSGLSFVFTDMLADGFNYLDPLFTSNDEAFAQYFTNEKMEYAARYGVEWLGKTGGFQEYQLAFQKFYDQSLPQLDRILRSTTISPKEINEFVNVLSAVFEYYSKMDFQFTNLTYLYAEENSIIKENLELLSKFKDDARLWINNLAIDDKNYFTRLLEKISIFYKVDLELLDNYKISELLMLESGYRVPVDTINAREESFTIYVQNDIKKYLNGKDSIDFISDFNALSEELVNSDIEGQVANYVEESVQGKVRIINVDYGNIEKMNDEISIMEKGEILISEFTAPELILACQKAKAIVTDLGGMLSHAAIVSRELGIPCLVGTRNATLLLEDGDDILIDFSKGVVTKI